MLATDVFEEDHEIIYLEPDCAAAVDESVGRLWCENDEWGVCGCEESGRKSTKYIRYDLFDAERAKVESLSEVIESQKQTHDALIKKCRELEAQNAVMREALENAELTLRAFAQKYTQQTDQAAPLKNFDFAAFGHLRSNALSDADRAQKALSLTQSESVEMVGKNDVTPEIIDAIEASRAAGSDGV